MASHLSTKTVLKQIKKQTKQVKQIPHFLEARPQPKKKKTKRNETKRKIISPTFSYPLRAGSHMPSTSLAADSLACASAALTTMSRADTATAPGAAPWSPRASLELPPPLPLPAEIPNFVGERDDDEEEPVVGVAGQASGEASPASALALTATPPPALIAPAPTVPAPATSAGVAAAAAAVATTAAAAAAAVAAEPRSSVLHRSALLSTVENCPVSHLRSDFPHADTCASDDASDDDKEEEEAAGAAVARGGEKQPSDPDLALPRDGGSGGCAAAAASPLNEHPPSCPWRYCGYER